MGAIPFGYLVARSRGVNIFHAGSGNIGATNVGRVLGKGFGILVFLLDFAKGALPVAAALTLKDQLPCNNLLEKGWLEVGAGLAAFIGHLYPIYLGFRGGKGVATGAGVVALLVPGPALLAALAWLIVVAATNYVSLGSLAAAVVLCAASFTPTNALADPRLLFCVVAGALVFIKHRGNISRLRLGTETQVRWGQSMRKVIHVLALGLCFGSAVFFNFVVTPSLFDTFERLGENEARPAWFPLPSSFARSDAVILGPKEQGSRAFGYAVGPLFPWYFVIQGLCAFVSAWTALAWARDFPGVAIHRWRARLLLVAFILIMLGWPLERKVTALRLPRNEATDAYLQSQPPPEAVRQTMLNARAEFGAWHLASMALNFAAVLLVSGGMALAGSLPAGAAKKAEPPSPITAP